MAFKLNKPNNKPRGETPPGKVIEAQGLEIQQFKLKAHQESSGQAPQAFDEVLKAARRTKKKKRNSRKNTLTKEAKERAVKGRTAEIAAFILVGGPIALFLYSQHQYPTANINLYIEARTYIIPVAWLLIAYEGWKNTNLSGVLCALLPPYWIYFLISEVDNRVMRGAVSALVVILVLEAHWTPDIAWMNGRQDQFNRLVGKVHTVITRPADPYNN